MKPIFSVVTPSYNQGEFINETISSVISQQGDFYIDYIIQDGGSNDNTDEIVKNWIDKINIGEFVELKGIKFFKFDGCLCNGISIRYESKKDKGQYDAINIGISKSVGDIFGYLCSDDIYNEFILQIISNYYKTGFEIISGNALMVNKQNQIRELYPAMLRDSFTLSQNCYISQPSTFIDMNVVKKVGLFNTNIHNSGDYEYWLRAESLGVKFKFVDHILSRMRIYDDGKTTKNKSKIFIESIALSKIYSGRIAWRHRVFFAQEISRLGIISRKLVRLINKFQEKFIGIYSRLFLLRYTDAINREVENINSFKNKNTK